MPSLTQQELNQRRMKVVAALLSGVPRRDVAERIGSTKRTVARDIAAIRKAIGDESGHNRDALEETIGALQDAGRLERIDSARIATLRSIATQLDTDTTNSMMFRVYWDALEAMTGDGDDDGAVAGLLADLFPNARHPQAP